MTLGIAEPFTVHATPQKSAGRYVIGMPARAVFHPAGSWAEVQVFARNSFIRQTVRGRNARPKRAFLEKKRADDNAYRVEAPV